MNFKVMSSKQCFGALTSGSESSAYPGPRPSTCPSRHKHARRWILPLADDCPATFRPNREMSAGREFWSQRSVAGDSRQRSRSRRQH